MLEHIRCTIALEDVELSSIRVGIGYVCTIVDCGTVPPDVISDCLNIEREERKKQGEKR